MPRILTALSALTSPTTRQVLLVPISRPTWILERAIDIDQELSDMFCVKFQAKCLEDEDEVQHD